MEILRHKGDVYKLSSEDLKKKISTPEGAEEVKRALAATEESPVVTPEEAAAKEAADRTAKEVADRAAADAANAEAARVAAESEAAKRSAEVVTKPWEAEDALYGNLGIQITRDAEGKIVKIVQEYQIKDDTTGAPIGRPTHLEAKTWPEFIAKKDECHTQATRAFNRLKSQKTSFKQQQPEQPTYKQLTDEEMTQAIKDLKGDDPAKAVAAARLIAGSEVAKDRESAREAEAKAKGQAIGYEFLKRHAHDFNPCKANSELIGKFLEENNLEFTLDNLELALIAKENELAPVLVPASRVEVPPVANPPAAVPSVPAVVTPTVPQAVPAVPQHPAAELAARQAAAAAAPPAASVPPVTQPVAENTPSAPTARPGVNGSIEPGSLSAQRPTVSGKPTLTKADILKMDKEQLKRMVKDPIKRQELNAILAQK